MKPDDPLTPLVPKIRKYARPAGYAVLAVAVVVLVVSLVSPNWWRVGWAPSPDEWSALWAFLGTLAAVAAGIVAVLALLASLSQLRVTLAQVRDAAAEATKADLRAQQESFDRNRPYVFPELKPSIGGQNTWDLVLRNTGGSIARDVSVSLEAEDWDHGSEDTYRPALEAFLATQIDIAPGAVTRIYWRFEPRDNRGQMGAPASGRIEVKYLWRDGDTEHPFSESVPYSTKVLSQVTPAAGTGTVTNGISTQTVFKNILHALRAIARHVGELNR